MKKIKTKIILIIAIAIFYSAGFYHLAKFETVDEHFWKFERAPRYWDAIKNWELKKTYINDKPGISVALISGLGMLFEPHPENLRVRDKATTRNNLLTVYDSSKTERVNLFLRLPILLLNGFFLVYFYWVIKKITSGRIALWSVIIMALSPILIGISQIINPDSLLWIFFTAGILSFFASLKTQEKKFIILTGVFTGFALLSKYSANLLFILYFFIILAHYFIDYKKFEENSQRYFIKKLKDLIIITSLSVLTFIFFFPATLIKIKYLYRGTVGAPGFTLIKWPFMALILLTALDAYFLNSLVLKKIGRFFSDKKQLIFKISSFIILAGFALVFLNCWTGQKFIPFDDIRDTLYQHKELGFAQILKDKNPLLRGLANILVQLYPFVFSQLTLILLIAIAFWIKIIYKGINKFQLYSFFFIFLVPAFFSSLFISNVSSNIRYSIILYPLFAFFAAIAINEFTPFFQKTLKIAEEKIELIISVILLGAGIIAILNSKPFYFNYTNSLLPKNFIITDSWGYGEYEAAQYLNGLPNAEELIIWSDRSAICQFIKGSCVRDYKIDLNKIKPDYIVLCKRGVIRHQFLWKYPEIAQKPSVYYYKKNPEWSIQIGKRPDNFVKVIKLEEK